MLRGGKSYVSARPAFATDAKRLLVCTGIAVSIFTTSTGLQISSLEGHNASVTSVIVVPGNKALSFCWTASVDGTIRYWDFAVAELMKTIDIKMPIFSMVVPSTMGQPVKEHKKMILMQLTFFLICLLKIPKCKKIHQSHCMDRFGSVISLNLVWLEVLSQRWNGRSFCGLAARHREKEVFASSCPKLDLLFDI